MRDPHKVLGVSKSASADEIKRAYRRLAKQYHPDTAGADAKARARFQEISDAYRALSTRDGFERMEASAAEANRAYTQPRPEPEPEPEVKAKPRPDPAPKASAPKETAPKDAGKPRAPEPRDDTGREHRTSDFFETLKRAGTKPFRRRGDDLACTLRLPFLDAARGGTHRVTLPTGRTLDVRLPAGVDDGRQIRLRGQGGAGVAGGEAGDALVTIEIEPHPYFSRDGDDIRLALPVSIAEAVEGGRVQVPTVDGKVWMTIPPKSNSGSVLRLAGRGLKGTDGTRGHQYVELVVVLPDADDAELQTFVRNWSGKTRHDPRGAFGLS